MLIQINKDKLTESDIAQIIMAHESEYRYKMKLKRYYNGQHDIMGKLGRENSDINNRLTSNFCAYISNMSTGYFLGQPISYSSMSDNTAQVDALLEVFRYNDEAAHNLELAENASIMGEAFELIYLDSDAEIRLGVIPSEEVIMVCDATIEQNPLYAIRHYRIYNVDQVSYTEYVDVYDAQTVKHYSYNQGLKYKGEESHYIGDVPIIHYPNNHQRRGDFEDVISLVDAYNKAQSLTMDDLEDFTDAFLVLKNMGGTDLEDVKKLRRGKVIILEDTGNAEWLTKKVNDTYVENIKTRIQKDIHKFSNIPDMTEARFGTASGIAIKYRMIGLEQVRSRKEREFKKSLQQRIEIISGILKLKNKQTIDFRDIDITFTANMFIDTAEQAQIVTMLDGIVSRKSLLKLLSFVEDPHAELEELAKEQDGDLLDDYDVPSRSDRDIAEEIEVDAITRAKSSTKATANRATANRKIAEKASSQ